MDVAPVTGQVRELSPGSPLKKKDEPGETFLSVLKDALKEVDQLQKNADKLTQQYLTGETTDIAEVLLAVEKASLAMQLTLQVRNKIVEAYQEVSRMQI